MDGTSLGDLSNAWLKKEQHDDRGHQVNASRSLALGAGAAILLLPGCADGTPEAASASPAATSAEPIAASLSPDPSPEPAPAPAPVDLALGSGGELATTDGGAFSVKVNPAALTFAFGSGTTTTVSLVPVRIRATAGSATFGEHNFTLITTEGEPVQGGSIHDDELTGSLGQRGIDRFAYDPDMGEVPQDVSPGHDATGLVAFHHAGRPTSIEFHLNAGDKEPVFRWSMKGAKPPVQQAVGTGTVLGRLTGSTSRVMRAPTNLPDLVTLCWDMASSGNNIVYTQQDDSGQDANLLVNTVGAVAGCKSGVHMQPKVQVISGSRWVLTFRKY